MLLLERQRLRSWIAKPASFADVEPKLAKASPAALAALAADPKERWWRRQPCALALRGRVPVERAAELFARVSDGSDVAEVRRALLEALCSSPAVAATVPLLEWLRAQEEPGQAYGMYEAILAARARLGDRTAVPALATLAYDAWTHRRMIGEAALDAMIEAHGVDAIVQALGAASPTALALTGHRAEDRLLGMRLSHRQGLEIGAALRDEDVVVARAAYERLCDGRGASDAALLALVAEGRDAAAACHGDDGPTGAAGGCFWALCVLARRGHDVRPWWHALGEPRVPAGVVPEEVRLAILRTYLPGERRTDPRLLLEAACVDLPPEPDEAEQLARASAALAAAGLAPQEPRSAAEVHQQGEGTFHAIDTAEGRIDVSALGPFVRLDAAPRASRALKAAGFQDIDPIAGIEMTGLCVYSFGRRDPLCIADLLFYWQD